MGQGVHLNEATEAKGAARFGARGTVIVGVGILLHLSSVLAAIRHAGFLVGVRGVGVGFLSGCPVLPQQRCCLPAAAVFGVIQGGAAL